MILRGILGLAILALLADAAPSCGNRRRPAFSGLELRASDCSCAADPITITVDGRDATTITCGARGAVRYDLRPGLYTVAATSGSRVWPGRSVEVRPEESTLVELGCPPAPGASAPGR